VDSIVADFLALVVCAIFLRSSADVDAEGDENVAVLTVRIAVLCAAIAGTVFFSWRVISNAL